MAHISTITTAFSRNLRPANPKNAPRCAARNHPQNYDETRRFVTFSISLIFFPSLSSSIPSLADNVFDRYVKRKKLEPLETYVPAVILTQLQIKDIEKSLEVDEPQYAAYRTVLRSGPAASFRSNVRAVAQYASDDGNGKTAFDDVERCLRALDELDSLFLRASRNNPAASAKLMKEKIVVAVNAVDSLLQTVPSDVLDKGKAIADAHRTPEIDVVPQELDPDLKKLQSIL
ncbi:hypothetical protein RND81_03G115500 [Saponaria officinalis]|uniref:DUF7880 domain-containing protein n=1 Tax=Saponaria officinalis TaxID=3572 RepID=A0AAW1LZW9_SAPOF